MVEGWSHMTSTLHSDELWPYYMILEVSWDVFWTLLLGSHDFVVTALGSIKKWP